jgi:hypothetical protein
MKMREWILLPLAGVALFAGIFACNFVSATSPNVAPSQPMARIVPQVSPPTVQASTDTPAVTHVMVPLEVPQSGKLVYDVDTQPTGAEGRTPYGDSYQINRLERPFLQNMTYVPALDIETYTVSSDKDWWYVSMALAGASSDPTTAPNYGVELDRDHDGSGEFLIWAHPPYGGTWDTRQVEIFQDKNHDTGGLSAEKCDAPLTTDGYETKIFNGGVGDADPDTAWVRLISSAQPQVQFAFKKSWSGTVFMLGVLADSGLKDPQKLDYIDRFTPEEAGSPVRSNSNYPLKALYSVDNVCREAFGFAPTGYEPQLCPRVEPTRKPRTPTEQPGLPGCAPHPPCDGIWTDYPNCCCNEWPA